MFAISLHKELSFPQNGRRLLFLQETIAYTGVLSGGPSGGREIEEKGLFLRTVLFCCCFLIDVVYIEKAGRVVSLLSQKNVCEGGTTKKGVRKFRHRARV